MTPGTRVCVTEHSLRNAGGDERFAIVNNLTIDEIYTVRGYLIEHDSVALYLEGWSMPFPGICFVIVDTASVGRQNGTQKALSLPQEPAPLQISMQIPPDEDATLCGMLICAHAYERHPTKGPCHGSTVLGDPCACARFVPRLHEGESVLDCLVRLARA